MYDYWIIDVWLYVIFSANSYFAEMLTNLWVWFDYKSVAIHRCKPWFRPQHKLWLWSWLINLCGKSTIFSKRQSNELVINISLTVGALNLALKIARCYSSLRNLLAGWKHFSDYGVEKMSKLRARCSELTTGFGACSYFHGLAARIGIVDYGASNYPDIVQLARWQSPDFTRCFVLHQVTIVSTVIDHVGIDKFVLWVHRFVVPHLERVVTCDFYSHSIRSFNVEDVGRSYF